MKRILLSIALLVSAAGIASAQYNTGSLFVGGGFYAAKQVSSYNGNSESYSGPGLYLAMGMGNTLTKGIDYAMEFFYETYTLDTRHPGLHGSRDLC